jgi:hypothetical protein
MEAGLSAKPDFFLDLDYESDSFRARCKSRGVPKRTAIEFNEG